MDRLPRINVRTAIPIGNKYPRPRLAKKPKGKTSRIDIMAVTPARPMPCRITAGEPPGRRMSAPSPMPTPYVSTIRAAHQSAATMNLARRISKRGTGTASRSFSVPSVNSRPNNQLIARQKKKNPPRAVNSISKFRYPGQSAEPTTRLALVPSRPSCRASWGSL